MACNSICSYDDSYSTDYRWHTLQAYWHTSHFVAVNEDGCVHCIKTRFKQNGETMSHNITIDSGNPFAPPLNDWRSEGAPPNIHFHERPSHILVPTMHTHCCIPVVHGQFWVQFSQITPMQWTNQELCLCFSKTSSTTWAVFTCSWSAGLKGAIFMMDANPLLNRHVRGYKWR